MLSVFKEGAVTKQRAAMSKAETVPAEHNFQMFGQFFRYFGYGLFLRSLTLFDQEINLFLA